MNDQILQSDFHDSSLFKCLSSGSELSLFLRNVSVDMELEEYYSVTVKLTNTRALKRNGSELFEFRMETSTCEVLQLSFVEGHGTLLVEWHTFQPSTQTFARYDFDYENFALTITKQDDLIF